MSDLPSCPFCGGTDIGEDEWGQPPHTSGCMACNTCGATGPVVGPSHQQFGKTMQDAWSNRAILPEINVPVEPERDGSD